MGAGGPFFRSRGQTLSALKRPRALGGALARCSFGHRGLLVSLRWWCAIAAICGPFPSACAVCSLAERNKQATAEQFEIVWEMCPVHSLRPEGPTADWNYHCGSSHGEFGDLHRFTGPLAGRMGNVRHFQALCFVPDRPFQVENPLQQRG
jgi:hypothetical protein